MWKALRYVLYLTILLLIFSVTYKFREYYYIPFIQNYLNTVTDSKLKFRNFDIAYKNNFLELYLYNIEYNNKIFLDKATLRFETEIFKKDYKNLKTPLKSLVAVELFNLTITEKNNTSEPLSVLNEKSGIIRDIATKIQNKIHTDVFFGKVNIIKGDSLIKVTDIKMSVDKQINISANLSFKKYYFSTEGTVTIEKDLITSDLKINAEGPVKSNFDLSGKYNIAKKTFSYKIKTDKLTAGRLVFEKLSATVTKNSRQFKINSKGSFGQFFFTANDINCNIWSSQGNIKIKDIADIFSADVSYKISKTDRLDLSANINNITVLGSRCGNLTVNTDKNKEIINFDAVHSLGNRITAVSDENGNYKISLYNKKTAIGTFEGNYKKGEISSDIKNLPVNKLMFMSSKNKNVKGTLSLYGNIKENGGSLILNAKNLSSRRLKKFDVSGKLLRTKKQWSMNIATKDKKLVFGSSFESKDKYRADLFYSDIDFNNILKILGMHKLDIYGKASGYIKYNSKYSDTKFNIRLKNGSLYQNKFSSWKISGNISATGIKISTFRLNGNNTSVNLKTSLSFSKDEPYSYLNCKIKNFKIKGADVNLNTSFTGHLSDDEQKINGILINNIGVNQMSFSNKASLSLTPQRIVISGINDGNNLSGYFIYNFINKKIASEINAKKAKISKYYDGLKGILNLKLSLKGTSSSPKINFSYNIQNASYNKINFSSKATLTGDGTVMNLKNFEILSSDKKGYRITAEGKTRFSDTDIKLNFKNFSEKEINKFVGFRTPLKGLFYGEGTITGAIDNLQCSLSIYSDEIFIKSLKFNSLNSKIKIQNKKITLNDSTVKYKDSEIKIPEADFDLKTGKYSSAMKLINTHAGPLDIFGDISIKGKMNKKRNGSTYSGQITLSNIWINKYILKKLPVNYTIAGRKFNFYTGKKSTVRTKGTVDFNKYPYILFSNISVSDRNMLHRFSFNGKISDKEININANAANTQTDVLADILDFPFDTDGYINFNLKSSGQISNPSISLTANSKTGSISGITYDNLDIKTTVKNNMLNINRFRINKNSEFTAYIKGTYPFAIDSSMRNKIKDSKVSISYELKGSRPNIIKEITDGDVTAKKGTFYLKGTVKGPLKNTTNTGELKANIAGITTNSYIHKIKNFNLTLKWKDNLLKIEEFAAKAGSGLFNITGNIRLSNSKPSFYDLSVFSNKKGIPVTVKELPIPTSGFFKIEKTDTFTNYSKAVPTFDLKLYGKSSRPKLTGWIKLENTKFCFPSPVQTENKSKFSINDIFPDLFIDIDLISAASTNFENSFVNMYLNGKVNIKGDIGKIKSNGIIESSDGRFSYMGNDFSIINSKIEIINNDVFISGEAETEVYSAGDNEAEVIKVTVDRSKTDSIKTRFSSKNDPTMDSQKALARLTKTEPSQSSSSEMSTDFFVKQQAVRMLSANVAVPIANTILKKTGVVDNIRVGYVNQDNVKLEDKEEATLADLLYGMKYSVEKNINRLLQIGYSVTFDQITKEKENENEKEIDFKHALELSFKLNKDLFLKGSYGLNSDNEMYEPEKKVMLEQRIRFGGNSKKNK